MSVILGIESSCDDTSAAVCIDGKIVANLIANQSIHEKYGGVVPELASRAHQQNIVPVVDEALRLANINIRSISAIAFTEGPGLLGSLLVGCCFGKSLAQALNVPLIGVNHMKGHVLAHFIEDPKPSFPFLCLTVSGGHTQIVMIKDYNKMEIIGETKDDAAGEAFDKIAKMIGLPYPGGPQVDKLAQNGHSTRFEFPFPRMEGLDFSFSGLKTAVLYFLQKQVALNSSFIEENIEDICASVQHRIVTILLSKLKKASIQTGIKEIAIAGGVSANSYLRKLLGEYGQKYQWNTYIPKFEYCTDNAAMIAIAGYYLLQKNETSDLSIFPKAKMSF